MRLPRGIVLCLVLAALAGLGIFVWPTRYRYEHLKQGNNEVPVSIDRFSGRTEALTWDGWRTMAASSEKAMGGIPPDDNPAVPGASWRDAIVQTPTVPTVTAVGDLPEWEFHKITGKCAIVQTDIECEIYNGTDRYRLSEITIEVNLRNHGGSTRLSRSYNLAPIFPSPGTPPLRSSRFSCRTGVAPESGQNWGWEIQSVKEMLASQ